MKFFNTKQSHPTDKGYTFFPTNRKTHWFNDSSNTVKEVIWKNNLDNNKNLHRYYLCEGIHRTYIGDAIGEGCCVFLTKDLIKLVSFTGSEKLIKERKRYGHGFNRMES